MSMMRFSNLEINKREVSLNATYEDTVDLWFKFDREIEVTSTQVALAMATLCGTKYEQVIFDFEVDSRAVETIQTVTSAEVTAVSTTQARPVSSSDGNVLSFSGGFDSLSAWRLMPEGTNLVSLDFGGWFEREAEFFRDFDTLIISTNARSEPTRKAPLTRNHWSFMAIGAILAAGYFNSRYHTFGQIFGESMARAPRTVATLPVLSELGFREAGYARGLTEVGTASIILQSDPLHVPDSLRSLAAPRDRKAFRKTAVSSILADKHGIDVNIPAIDFGKSPKINFGDDYASSLSAMYCMAKGNGQEIEGLFDHIPDKVRSLVKECTFDFMEKVCWDAYSDFPRELVKGLCDNLIKYRLEPYTESDWDEVKQVRTLLSEQHKIARENAK